MKKTREIFISILLIAVALSARWIPGPRIIDDAYITFRYSRNLIAGEGLVFNPGEKVLGTTTPIYSLLMAGVGVLTGGEDANFPLLALIVNALADAVTAVYIWRIGKKCGYEIAGIATGLVWGIATYSVTFAIGGLETSLYVMFLTIAIWAYISGKRFTTTIVLSFAVLTRPDAVILVGLIGLDWLLRYIRLDRSMIRIRDVLGFTIPVVMWVIFSTLYYGSPIPHSIQAKIGAYLLSPDAAFIRLIQHFATPFQGDLFLGPTAIAIGLVIFPALFIIGSRAAIGNISEIKSWVFYPIAYFLFFAIANPLIFRWYLTPPLTPYLFFILVGMERLLRQISISVKQFKFREVLIFTCVALFPIVGNLSEWTLSPDHGPRRPAPVMAYIQLELLYEEATKSVLPLLKPGATLAAGDVGVLGYFTNAKILDTVGLNSPETLKYYPLDENLYSINYAVAPQLILDEKPELLVILEVYGREGLLKDINFLQDYELINKLETDIYSSDGMLVFKRRNL